ncbi:TVP38/TMEM64 family protein [Roseimaritima sediminicola]|uniref:TVP38/TMEM64 family protein n=1 Tax=Roseimaritima sediminicola TaxID=2662066 RepID=UPI00129829FB|nr:VTT domain-containing protein [Roseimaritima sediminicola]
MIRRISLLVGFLLVLAVLWWAAREYAAIDAILEQETQLRERVARNRWLAGLIGFAIYVALSFVPGTLGKSIIYGWLFGFWMGLVIASVSLTAAAVGTMLTVRYVFREWVEKRMAGFIKVIDKALHRHGPMYMISLRLLHAPYTLTNYASGATGIAAPTFAWTTYVGMLPGTIVFVLAGARLPSLETMVEQGVWGIVDLPLLVALSLLAILPVIAKALRDRYAQDWQDA